MGLRARGVSVGDDGASRGIERFTPQRHTESTHLTL